ncbi:sensor domain-containing diguanylate cyclase [Methylophaga sp. OBS1]|uniref:sensor domain-containing diguanylate cyclase n=1 Tax=Methylophaga sp. OBS1 TaxID=2991933 RepID=UPI00224FF08A|nr:sensor domain-containing diguanylate cyclase [Methylophaga sp. OBS1]MCX4191427.1 sensor domain-containing diguanylate cyclase [Methylophaga sp. OBS1]MCX4191627.1 sensor domain-containing diguanylate cyclase [Methylophaga sp. OBS1]
MAQFNSTSHPKVSNDLLRQWQTMLDLLAEYIAVPVALIMRLDHDKITVCVKNSAVSNPYQIGETEVLLGSGLYCEEVVRKNAPLFVENALNDPAWQNNPDVERHMINYFGLPLRWPDGDIFGTLCVLDSKSHHYDDKQLGLIEQMQLMVESHLDLLEKNHKLEKLSRDLKNLADTDELTGIWNRRAFIAESNKELQRAQRGKNPVCLLMMDIDDFKEINDAFGHEVGDEVLKLFTHCISANKRTYDIFGRIGGEEFAMLMPETRRAEAMDLAERIRSKVSEIFFHKHSGDIKITVCIGVYELASNDTTILAALSKADERLYAAKRAGKNRVMDCIS